MMPMRILILEDDPFRVKEFEKILQREGIDCSIFPDSAGFLRELALFPADVRLISLDHDLSPVGRPCGVMSIDCGCAAVEFMKGMKPICPVIIHSQNIAEANTMAETLRLHHWEVTLVCDPPEDVEGSWIEHSWTDLVLREWDATQ